MIDLMIKNILKNTSNIEAIIKHIKKSNTKISLNFILVATALGFLTVEIKEHEKKINYLETKLEEIKSKGE